MQSFELIAVALLGAVVGSFLNVVALRLNTGMTLGGRSRCFSCGKTLRWFELLPVFSFLFQRGRCRGCGSRISWQYPAGELLSAVFFLIAWLAASSPFGFAWLAVLLSLLHIILFYDLRHKIIPDGIVWAFALLSFAGLFVRFGGGGVWIESVGLPPLSALLAGPALALPFALLWLLSRGRAMGLGDAKLILGLGWLLGPAAGASAAIIAFWLAAFAVLPLLLSAKLRGYAFRGGRGRLTMKSEVPLGPFLILAAALMILWPLDLLRLSALFGVA